MKNKILITSLLLFSVTVFAQIVDIPDGNFKFRLLNHTGFGGVQIDTNLNNEIEVSEAEAIAELIVGDGFANNYQIVNMTGIEAFINITSLNCFNNQIEALDLSQNTLLEYLRCDDNNISSLNVSQCIALVELNCYDNELTSLDVSNNALLEELRVSENYLSTLDVINNNNLEVLACSYNQITFLNVSQNLFIKKLYCHNNLITNLNTSQNILLNNLFCQNNQLANLDITQNTYLLELSFRNNNLIEIDVSQCIQLEKIWGVGNQLASIDLTSNTNLLKVYFEDNQLIFLDIRNGSNNLITHFDSTGNPNLTCIFVDDMEYCEDNWTDIDPNSHFVETQEDCNAIGVEENQLSEDFTIYPNPTTDVINIKSQIPNHKPHITITDILGREIQHSKLSTHHTEIDISNYSKGIYFLTIQQGNKTLTKKIIKL